MAKKLKKHRSQQRAAKKRSAKKQRKQAIPQKVSELTKLERSDEWGEDLLFLKKRRELTHEESSNLDAILAEIKRRYESGDRSGQFRQMINAACEFTLDTTWEYVFWERAESFLTIHQFEELPMLESTQANDAYDAGQREVCRILGLDHQEWIRSLMTEDDLIIFEESTGR